MEMIEIRCDIQSGVYATILSTCLYVWSILYWNAGKEKSWWAFL